MNNDQPRWKQRLSLLIKVLLIELVAVLIGIGITYYYVDRFGSQIFEPVPTLGQIVKMGFDRPVFMMGMLSTMLPIVFIALIIIAGFIWRRVRALSIIGAVLLALFWLYMTWAYWYAVIHR